MRITAIHSSPPNIKILVALLFTSRNMLSLRLSPAQLLTARPVTRLCPHHRRGRSRSHQANARLLALQVIGMFAERHAVAAKKSRTLYPIVLDTCIDLITNHLEHTDLDQVCGQ